MDSNEHDARKANKTSQSGYVDKASTQAMRAPTAALKSHQGYLPNTLNAT
jgi:hypothetical protein